MHRPLSPEPMGTDGASLAVPAPEPPRVARLFASKSILWKMPDGTIADMTVLVVSRRRWEGFWKAERPNLHPVKVGPLVVAVGLMT